MIYHACQGVSPTGRAFAHVDEDNFETHIFSALNSLAQADASRIGARVLELKSCGANWDGRGSAASNHAAASLAIAVLHTHAERVRKSSLEWRDPHVGLNEEGDVVFEWWNGEKKLTLYVGASVVEYVKSWGPDIDLQMQAGVLDGELLRLWQWLLSPALQ